MEEMLQSLPQHTCSWLTGKLTLYKYQDFWTAEQLIKGRILAQQTFRAEPSDVFLCSFPKTGTTWLKSLAFAIASRGKYDESTSPLLTNLVHECVPFLEGDIDKLHKYSNFGLVATHLPYSSLPESVLASNCKIVYIYRNTKDVIVSLYHFLREVLKVPMEDAPFKEIFEEFCQGICSSGPYWDHIMEYWNASLEREERILLLKYEDLRRDPTSNAKRLAEFIGCPFSLEEEEAGVVDKIIDLCSFENLSNLEVNKTGKPKGGSGDSIENRLYYRKGKDGDWKNYFSDEMKEKIDKLMDQKLGHTGLLLK